MSVATLLRAMPGRFVHCVWVLVKSIFHWLLGIGRALLELWRALGPRWLRVSALILALVFVAVQFAHHFLAPNFTRENITRVEYLNEGWSDFQRQSYYYTPQGTELLGMDYSWFLNLELPLSDELLATADNMRGWGFIMAPGQRADDLNPGNLPVGLGRHIDPVSGKERLDMGCALCHTGELHFKGTALRIDGGQSVISLSDTRRGEFISTLAASVFETLFNPFKWDRFATRVVGDDAEQKSALKSEVWAFAKHMKQFMSGGGNPKYYPLEEGRGRTDAVGRIANVVFGYDLDVPANYRIADAPASYPFLWDIWRFDWVQYTGFTNQAMARNVGEALGVLAPIKLVNDKGELLSEKELGQTVVDVEGQHCVEGLLRMLKPPKWPESILGKINIKQANQGKQLFAEHCVRCHGPHISQPYNWPVADEKNPQVEGQLNTNWQWDMAGDITEVDGKPVRRDWRTTIWSMPWIDIDTIGTDPKLANNYMDNRYDGSKLVSGSAPVNAGDGLQLLLNILVPKLYRNWNIPAAQTATFDGLNVPFRIANQRAYKARPLHGVWATPPFLHNGSVPSIYDLLSPLAQRPTTFFVGNREYDPDKLGYRTEESIGSFKLDTSSPGNQNIGHQFTDENASGRIGPLLQEAERYALLEYLKVMGNPDFASALGGDPQNWDHYSPPPNNEWSRQSCRNSHLRHGITDVSINTREVP